MGFKLHLKVDPVFREWKIGNKNPLVKPWTCCGVCLVFFPKNGLYLNPKIPIAVYF